MIAKANWTAESWRRLTRWVAAACLLVLSTVWGSPAFAATSTWWDCNYEFRKKITITAGSASVTSGYSVKLTFDHAALVAAGQSQADGDDIRILYWNGSAWVQLDRVLDIPDENEGSSWNSASTTIWFRTQAAIGASASDDNYYLYYGNASATSPPANALNVFLFHDDFPGSSINTSKWTVTRGTVSVSNGELTLNVNSSIWATASYAFGTATRWEARVRLGAATVQYFNYWAASDADGFTGNWIKFRTTSTAHEAQTDAAATTTTTITVSSATSYRIYAFNREGTSNVRFYQDTTEKANHTTNIPTVNLRPFAWSENGTNTQRYDWVRVRRYVSPEPTTALGSEEGGSSSRNYFSPDAAAAGMHVPVTFVGNFCAGLSAVTTSSSDIIVGPSIMTDANGNVVTSLGKAVSTIFFIKPDARPATGITVSLNGTPLSQTFDIVIPTPDPNVTSGTTTLSGRTKRGTKVLGGLTVGSGGTLTINTTDTDAGTAGNQGYLPPVLLVKGDVNIAGTVDVKGQNGTNGAANCTGGEGGVGGPGGGGGGGGGVKQGSCTGVGGLIDVRVSTSSDDAEETVSGGGMDLTGGLDISTPIKTGLRFQTVTIPQGSSITNAYIVFTAENSDSLAINLTFTGQAIDNAPTFTTTAFNISSRTATSASVPWNNVPAWTSGVTYQTPNLSAIIQEIVNRSGWASGNSLVIMVTAASADERDANSYNSSSTQAPLLHVDYNQPTAAPGGAGLSGGGGGGSKVTGPGAAGGDGTGTAGAPAFGTTGGAGGTALGGASGGGGGGPHSSLAGGGGGGGGTGNPSGTGGSGASTDGATGGQGGGGGGAPDATPGGGAGGGFALAGTRGSTDVDAGYGGGVTGNAQLVPLAGGSGGGGGAPDLDIASVHRGGGGGGGGGAVLIYATGSVTLTGTITAQGGNGGNGGDGSGGGGGSGGAVLIQSGTVTTTGTLTTAGGTGGTGPAGGAGGSGRIRIDGLASGVNISTILGTADSRFIGPVIDTLVDQTVKGRADGGSSITLYVYNDTGAQVGSPYTTSASGSTGTVGTWSVPNVTFPSGVGYLAVKQSSGSYAVFGPGRATKGLHLINWREVY